MSEDIFSPKNYKIGGIIKASDFTMNEMEKVKKMAEALEKAKKSDSGQALEYQALAKQKKIDDDEPESEDNVEYDLERNVF